LLPVSLVVGAESNRKSIADACSQEHVLFNTTIKQNILMGAVSDVTESDLIEAAKKANCHNFISKLPK